MRTPFDSSDNQQIRKVASLSAQPLIGGSTRQRGLCQNRIETRHDILLSCVLNRHPSAVPMVRGARQPFRIRAMLSKLHSRFQRAESYRQVGQGFFGRQPGEQGRMMRRLVWAGVQGNALSVWREAFGIIRRYPLASGFPAGVLGMLGAAPYFFIVGKIHVREEILTSLTGAFAFYLYIVYVAYAEEVTAEAERGVVHITMRGVLHMLRQASPVVPSAIVASVAAIIIPRAATILLVIPGLWLLTRWSLFAPVISRERLGPMEALKRSNGLVRDHFWLVFLTATLAFVLEETIVHAGALVGHAILGSDTWGE